MELSTIIEALLIASEEPLSSSELVQLIRARISEAEDDITTQIEDGEVNNDASISDELKLLKKTDEQAVIRAIAQLNEHYQTSQRAFLCMERAKGWKIFTKPQYADFVRQLFPEKKPARLSGPAMETLAIIAYRQPVTKASIEAVRGVSCDGMLQKLLDRELVKVGGRAPLPGRPLLYETTDLFFEHFGIKSVDDLPNVNELRTVKLPEPEEQQASSDEPPSHKPQEVETQLALSAIDEPPQST